MTHLLITVQWLDDRYHGLLGREGPPEWPPSPFRLFQALVAGVGRRDQLGKNLGKALEWLEKRDAPIILAPPSCAGTIITRFVPNNDGDKKIDRQDRLTSKTSRPTIMLAAHNMHYLWWIGEEENEEACRVCEAAKYLSALGWGIDMAFADARIIPENEINTLEGVRWQPRPDIAQDVGMLRTPIAGTLKDLNEAYLSALGRIELEKPLQIVKKAKVFEYVYYESKERPLGRPNVVFELRNDDGTRFNYPQDRFVHLAGMLRHLAGKLMANSPPEDIENPADWVRSFVFGHGNGDSKPHRQFSYLPMPTIGMAHSDASVRRIMIAAPVGTDRLLLHLAKLLEGQRLEPTTETRIARPPTLIRIHRDNVARYYIESATDWASVTPVILPGHDDHKPDKTRKLIEKALQQSGIEQTCEFEWSSVSRFPKSLSAHKFDSTGRSMGYVRPAYLLSKTGVHLLLRFNSGLNMQGPLVIGAGRHCGFGLMAGVATVCDGSGNYQTAIAAPSL